MIRRRIVLGLATLALVAVSASRPALAEDDPCATGAFTTYRVQEVIGTRTFIRLDGWIGPCASGAPLPDGFRRVSYYEDGTVIHYTEDPDPFTSTTGPTTFGGYIGVDASIDGSDYAGTCLAYNDTEMIACVTIHIGFDGEPATEPVAPWEVQQLVVVWPPDEGVLPQPNPTCGNCP